MKRIIYQTHLILGFISGVVIFIVAITGCIYAFKAEINSITQKWRYVEPQQDQSFLSTSILKSVAQSVFPDHSIHSINYGKKDEAAELLFYETEPLFYRGVILNPYTSEIIKIKNYEKDFFYVILQGHMYLWLPPKIGKPIVSVAVLIFLVMLITGIILWLPKKSNLKQSLKIKRNLPFKRKMYGFHSIMGVYASIILLVLTLTGLVWSFQWFSKSIYKWTGGKKELTFELPKSDTVSDDQKEKMNAIDFVWEKMQKDYPAAETIEIHFPHNKKESVYAHVNSSAKTYWKTEFRYFDQNTFKEIDVDNVWGKLEDASTADIIRRMNYDIHTGAIGGLAGKILVFFASLIAASLPVTGFVIWNNKRKEKNKLRKGLNL